MTTSTKAKPTKAAAKKTAPRRKARVGRSRTYETDPLAFRGKETPEAHRPKWALHLASHDLPVGAQFKELAHDVQEVTVKMRVRAEYADQAEAKVRALLGINLGSDSEVTVK